MSLVVLQPGLATTVQDLGRPGHQAWGVPPGGAFDRPAHAIANALVGNDPHAATLELTLLGGVFEARCDLALALGGAPMTAHIEGRAGRPLRNWSSFTLAAGDRLILGKCRHGCRAYLAVTGGWLTAEVLGSRSSETPLKAGDVIPAHPGRAAQRWLAEAVSFPRPLRILDGPEASWVSDDRWKTATYRATSLCSRIGIRLEGLQIPVASPPERLSAPVAPGAVQVAGGQPIILGMACGTIGGYPHVAHVVTADLPVLAQLRPGDPVNFETVTLEEARRLDDQQRLAVHRRCSTLRTLAVDRPSAWPD